ncbi:MAG: MMPL family transporter, partial [Candidatus Aureabacteria bacterium]|nr:MMPL family transporter [Candidatus Auribacterota bacterium]
DPREIAAALRGMGAFWDEWRRWLAETGKDRIDASSLLGGADPQELSVLRSGGYLVSRNGRLLFLFVRPRSSSDEISALQPFVGAVRAAVARALEQPPGLKGSITTALTGMPAHALTEIDTINSDIARPAAISVILVLAILFAGFRSPKKILLACIPLVCGMIMTAGLIAIAIGHLNMVSSSFLAVLFGIGIDFAIYLTRRTAEELGYGRSREEAVHTAVTESGKSVLTGGLTTGFAFLAVAFCDFVGFSELGITAGIGVLVVLTSTFLMLPSILLRSRISPQRYRLRQVVEESRRGRHRALLYLIVLLAAAGAGFGIYAATRLKCDFNALKLLPSNAESTVYQLKMQNESDFQMTGAAVTAGSLEELRMLAKKIRALPLVGRVDSLADLIPPDQEEKLREIARARPYLEGLSFAFSPVPYDGHELGARLDRIAEHLSRAEESAFAGGQSAIVAAIEGNLAALGAISSSLRGEQRGQALARSRSFEKSLFAEAVSLSRLIRDWLKSSPIGEDDLPPELLSRFKSPRGNYVAYVFPDGPIWDIDFLDRFVAQLKAVAPHATGFPITHQANSHVIVASLLKALVYALLMIVVLLALDFRRAVPVLLALVPLFLGVLWVQAIMYLLGRSYDFASLPGLPLVLGLGIVYGVHIVDRWMEHPRITAFAATLTSGEGVALAALTTIAGLAGLLFSRHKGVESFGIILIIGIASCMIAALYVLPAVIDLIYLGGKRKHPQRPGREMRDSPIS